MIKLYACGSPNVTKVLFMLKEIGTPFTYEHISVVLAENYTPEFMALNPNAKVPVIIDDDGPGGEAHTVFESGAILIYLAEKYGKLIPADIAIRSEMLQWLFVQVAYFGPMFGQARHFVSLAPQEGNEYARERYISEVYRLLDVLETRLSQSTYLGCEEFSIADIAMFPGIEFHLQHTVTLGERPNIQRWVDEISQRSAWAATIAARDEILEIDYKKGENASDDQMDKVFGRGKYARTC